MNSKKRHNALKIVLSLIIILILVVVVLFSTLSNNLTTTKTITIEQGTSTTQIAQILENEGVISNKYVFLARIVLSEYKGKLKYGTFEFDPDDSIGDIIAKIAKDGAKKESVTITIPEGYSVEKIIELLESEGLGTKHEIEQALEKNYDFEFLENLVTPDGCKYRLQGFLFPSTYEFYTDATCEEIIETLLAEFEKQYAKVSDNYDNLYEIITKASLIEREARVSSDRAKIAGVIENRLNADMRLQIDATVVYAISDGLYNVERVLYRDLENDSPYNTYKHKELPIGPISNPGLESIKAAINPEKHNYLYYRTDEGKNDGSHVFTETFEEHKVANN